MKSSLKSLKIKIESGFATLTVLIFGSVMLLIVGAMLTYARGFIQPDLNSLLLYNSIDIIRNNFSQLSRNDKVWEATVAGNQPARMACYNNVVTPCAAPDPLVPDEEIVMYTVDSAGAGTPYYPSTGVLMPEPIAAVPLSTPYEGFTLDGSKCSNFYPKEFIPAPGSPKCMIHVRVRWRPFCASSCFAPPEKVILMLNFTISQPTTESQITQMGVFKFNAAKVDGPVPGWNLYR